MHYLIFVAYEFLTELFPFLLVLLLLCKRDKRRGAPASPRHLLLVCAFGVYLFGAFHFTGAGTLYDLLRYGRELHNGQLNLIPFSQHINVTAYVLNVVLFVPLGALLPMIWPRTDKFRWALLAGLAFSLLIELSQLVNHRATDVDDLIMNTAGAVAGYLLYKLFARVTRWRPARADYPAFEPFLYIAAVFLGRALLYNEMGLARLLYHF